MTKFRILTPEELTLLEKEFISFLVVNGITADDWEKLKHTDSTKTNEMIEAFSDVIFMGILRKTNYLEHYSPHSIKLFHCEENKISLIGLDLSRVANITFPINHELFDFINKNQEIIEIYRTEKAYGQDKWSEIYAMLNGGCVKTDGQLFRLLQIEKK